jgi:hypothetical protein
MVDPLGNNACTAVMLSTGMTSLWLTRVETESAALLVKPVLKLAMVALSVLITVCTDCKQLA